MGAAGLRCDVYGEGLSVYRVGGAAPLVVQNARPGVRPYLHPITAPDGRGVLTEDAPAHHPWQHGLYTGLNDVNGIGFWAEGPQDGRILPRSVEAVPAPRGAASWRVSADWNAPDGRPVLAEVQEWTLQDRGDTLVLDLTWMLRAAGADIRFGEYAYGGLFLRMPFRADQGGTAVNSEGEAGAAAEGRRARWVALSMPIEGRDDAGAGLALFDHPANPEHPVPWRVDGQLGVGPSRCRAGEWRLAAGETATYRHRAVAFTGPVVSAAVDGWWAEYAAAYAQGAV